MNRLALYWLVLCLCANSSSSAEQKQETIRFVRGLQAKDGGFLVAPGQKSSSLRATSAAVRALKYLGGEVPDRARCIGFVKSCYDAKAGGFVDHPGGKPDVFTTAVGMMVLKELNIGDPAYEAGVVGYLGRNAKSFEEVRIGAAALEAIGKRPSYVSDWETIVLLAFAKATKDATGDTAWNMARYAVTQLRIGGTLDRTVALGCVTVMQGNQRDDGGYGNRPKTASDLESSYQVMRAFHMLKAKPNVKKMRAFVASCRNKDGGYGVMPGKPSTVPATYYAAIILHWLDEK